MGLAQAWLHEGTGAIKVDLPTGTPNARQPRIRSANSGTAGIGWGAAARDCRPSLSSG